MHVGASLYGWALVYDFGDRGRLLPAFARTIRSVFGSVSVAAPGPGVR